MHELEVVALNEGWWLKKYHACIVKINEEQRCHKNVQLTLYEPQMIMGSFCEMCKDDWDLMWDINDHGEPMWNM